MRPSLCLPAISAPFELTKESAELLSAAAREGCSLCRGSGVSTWKYRGFRPEVCRCAREGWREYAAGEMEKVARQAAEVVTNPARLVRMDGTPL